MPIVDMNENKRMPILGKIRLGIRKESRSGSKYPSSVPYFVLKDAPEVEKVYGKDPSEIDAMFPVDDEERIIPTWFKWFAGGVRDKEGNIIGGKLQCYGDGVKAFHLAKKDPVTRQAPERACLKEKCGDWMKGSVQQCKQAMNVFVLLPRVSWFGVYQIDTTSWHSIRSFHDQVSWVKQVNNGIVRMIPFKILREETVIQYHDVKAGKNKQSTQWIMKLKPNESFAENHGLEMQKKMKLAFSASENYLLPSEQKVIEAPMEDSYEIQGATSEVSDQRTSSEKLLDDKEVSGLFDKLAALMKKEFPKKARLLAIRKKEKEADQKASVISTLKQKIIEATPKETPQAEPEFTPTTQTKNTPQQETADGLI